METLVKQRFNDVSASIQSPPSETTGTFYHASIDFPFTEEQADLWKSYSDVSINLTQHRVINYVGLVLNHVVREYDLVYQDQERVSFFTWFDSYKQILDRFRYDIDSATVIGQKPTHRASPGIVEPSFEIKIITNITPRIGKRYTATVKQPQKARFETNAAKIGY